MRISSENNLIGQRHQLSVLFDVSSACHSSLFYLCGLLYPVRDIMQKGTIPLQYIAFPNASIWLLESPHESVHRDGCISIANNLH